MDRMLLHTWQEMYYFWQEVYGKECIITGRNEVSSHGKECMARSVLFLARSV